MKKTKKLLGVRVDETLYKQVADEAAREERRPMKKLSNTERMFLKAVVRVGAQARRKLETGNLKSERVRA